MKKSLLTGLLQYIGAIVLVLCSVLTVYAFDAGKLPFMDADYLDTRSQAAGAPLPNGVGGDVQSTQPQQAVTAATFINSLPKASAAGVPYTGVYSAAANYLAVRPISGIGALGSAGLELRCGYVIKTENGNVLSVYDGQLNDVSAVVNGWSLTYLRDAAGNPLFTKDGQHAYVNNGRLETCSYDAVNLDKGVYCEYPAYLAGYDTNYTVYKDGGFYGLKAADGTVIVSPQYVDVYGMSEGYCVAVNADKRLFLFNKNGTLISDKYYAADRDNADAVGYYFVRNGITRARTADGVEVLLRTDGTVVAIPSGFEVCAYSDGAVLLKGASGYGYMSYNGRWISPPDYKLAMPFNEGLAVVCDDNGNFGMIDLAGNTVLPCVFTSVTSSSDGVILAYAQKYGYYVINKLQISA